MTLKLIENPVPWPDGARHVRTCIDEGSWTPRVEQMPYYDGRIPEWEPQEVAAAAE